MMMPHTFATGLGLLTKKEFEGTIVEAVTDTQLIDMIRNDLEPIPEYGDFMTAAQWTGDYDAGWFTRSDGSGYWATLHGMSRHDCFRPNPEPHRFTHVVWFNK